MEKQKRVTKVGRKPTQNPKTFRYYFRLNAEENTKFLNRFDESGFSVKADFIRTVFFEKEIKIIKIDKSKADFYMQLTSFHSQFRALGINYNLYTILLPKKTFLLSKLEKYTIEFVVISKEICHLTQEFEKCLQK